VIEQVQAFWDKRPCNVRHSKAPTGSDLWSREVTNRKYLVEPHIPIFAQFGAWSGIGRNPRWRNKRVLEIGCGIGTDTLEFCRAGVFHIDAVDLSSQSITLAFNRVANKGYKNAAFLCANAEDPLPPRISNEGFDLAYAFGVLHHTPHPGAVLKNMRACLRDDGELRIMLYAKWSIKNLLEHQPEAQAGCPIARVYSGRQARELLRACGFEVVSIRKTHIFPWKVSDYIEHRYVKCWYYRWMPKPLFQLLEKLLGWHLLIVARRA
jgi:SAM-dependent methyltransferase